MLPLIMTQTEQPMVGETRKGELRHVDFGGKMAARGIELTTRENATAFLYCSGCAVAPLPSTTAATTTTAAIPK